jgi:hypothetical protein
LQRHRRLVDRQHEQPDRRIARLLKEPEEMLFIEYVMTQGRVDPSVVYRVDTKANTLATAKQVAEGTLKLVRRMFPTTPPPDAFQIFNDNDQLVFRSWERINVPTSNFSLRLLGGPFSYAAA